MTNLNTEKIWLSSPHMGDLEKFYINEAFISNWIAPLGPNVTKFEEAIAQYYDNKVHVACLNSGTASIHLALILLGVGPGDEVLCQSFTFCASANPIKYLGATPVFIDSERETWNLCPELLEEAVEARIKAGKKPAAIIAVHLYGMPYKADEITAISRKFGIPVIEDSAEAFGSIYRNRKCGTLGEMGIISFNGNKIITTSGGGALVCQNPEDRAKAIHLATQAQDNAPHYQHSQIGYNYRMSNILAGIGRGQMEVLEKRVDARRKNFEFYKESFAGFSEISFLEEPDSVKSNRWLTTILTGSFELRVEIRDALDQENIESRPLWKPLHMQPVFSGCPVFSNGVSEDLFNRGLCLPSGSDLNVSQLERIVGIIKDNVL